MIQLMKSIKFAPLLFFLLSSVACDYFNHFGFSNNSKTDVYIDLNPYRFDPFRRDSNERPYPDTTISRYRRGELFKRGEARLYEYGHSKEDPWVDTLSLFIFDADTFNNYSWEEIQSGYKVLQRYDLSPEDLRVLSKKITYPPDERMKNMKMYPPYRK